MISSINENISAKLFYNKRKGSGNRKGDASGKPRLSSDMIEWDAEARKYGVTAIENAFITDYMPDAKGEFVKVYLWGLYRCGAGSQEDTLPQMALELGMTAAEVEAAFRYWERRGLVSRLQEEPPVYRYYSPLQRQHMPSALEVDTAYVDFMESVYAVFGEARKVSNREMQMAWEWVQELGLQHDTVLMLLNYCMKMRGVQFSFSRVAQPMAVKMKEAEVHSCEDAAQFFSHDEAVHNGAKAVLKRMGKRRLPSEDELTLYEKWIGEWAFTPDAVLDACRETTGGDPSFKYLDGILRGIRERGTARKGAEVQAQLNQEKTRADQYREVFTNFAGRMAADVKRRLYEQYAGVYPHAVLVLAAEECGRIHAKLEDWETLLQSWQNKGLQTEEEVRAYLTQFRESNAALKEIFDACGYGGRPTEKDRQLYGQWLALGLPRDVIRFAAEQARGAQDTGKMAYLDKVLQGWHQEGITTLEAAQARRAAGTSTKPAGKTVSAQQYAQREYTEEELMAVSEDWIEEAKRLRESKNQGTAGGDVPPAETNE